MAKNKVVITCAITGAIHTPRSGRNWNQQRS
jgi:uncharacterized protein (DUF849 family)